MKRSDMIKKLYDQLLDLHYRPLSVELADNIITFLEDQGMRSPEVDSDMGNVMESHYVYPNYNMWDEDFMKDDRLVELLNKRLERRRENK